MLTSTSGATPGSVKHSLHIVLTSLIDYAGLFPPAGLSMKDAVENYARYRANAEHSWMLGRFILPAARLPEFEQHFRPAHDLWHLSALAGPNLYDDLARIADFNARHPHAAKIDTLEVKAGSAEEIAALRKQVPGSLIVYFELNGGESLRQLVAAVGMAHSRAKIRTGGLTQEMFPSAEQIVQFIRACAEEHVPFKATAGLHHPVRCTRPFTYEKDSPSGMMHGFLNVFLAAALALDGASDTDLVALLGEQDGSAFLVNDHYIEWRGHRIPAERLLESRGTLGMSFGSCSFEEPVADLRALGLL